jgi:dTMP kinase
VSNWSNCRGRFIVVEGIDGGGKTTMVEYLAELIREKGHDVVTTKDPGGTTLGNKLRTLVLNETMSPMTELLLFTTVRQQLVDEVIKPNIEKGTYVISDRFIDSTYAYQGHGRGLLKKVAWLDRALVDQINPDDVLIFDISLEESIKRIKARLGNDQSDKFDNIDMIFKTRVYMYYQECLNSVAYKSSQYHRIDAEGDQESVKAELVSWVNRHVLTKGPEWIRAV